MGIESVVGGFEAGHKMAQQMRMDDALKALAGGDPTALQRIYALNPQLGMQLEDQAFQRGERQREAEYRQGASDMLLNRGGGVPVNALMASPGAANGNGSPESSYYPPRPAAPTASAANPAQPNEAPAQPVMTPRERAMRADPDKFLSFQGKQLEVTQSQFENLRDVHNMAMQILGGVHDQASYDAAKQSATQLYSSFNHDAAAFIDNLPQQYSPETIRDLQMQGMDTSKQLQAVARENKLAWDIEDDQIDNERADTSAASLADYRRQRIRQGDRPRPSRAPAAPKPPTPSTVIGRIMDKEAKGEALTPGERRMLDSYNNRGRKGGKGGASSAGAPVRVNTPEEARQLPKGTLFVTPDGRVKVR